jgi:hypothetical protein
MSNLLTSVETQILEAVTGGTTAAATQRPTGTATPRPTAGSSSNDQILATLNSLSTTLANLGKNTNNGGFTMTEALMFGMLMSQRSQVNVIVRRPFW